MRLTLPVRADRAGRARGTRFRSPEHVVGIGSRGDPSTSELGRRGIRTIHVWRACHAWVPVFAGGGAAQWIEVGRGSHCIPRNNQQADAVLWRPLRGTARIDLLHASLTKWTRSCALSHEQTQKDENGMLDEWLESCLSDRNNYRDATHLELHNRGVRVYTNITTELLGTDQC